ncbi:hypothetical protein GQ53DRAFT_824295 [Thozetella sp. PMI_491]|nr:hypothetical protein GQ53DRAFT_824295 [Thozetella sp. PMI_491]
MESSGKTVYQPLHPSIRGDLDPEYVAFHDAVLQYVKPSEARPWDPASRFETSPQAQGGMSPVEVGNVFDHTVGNAQLRVFVPEGSPPTGKWPSLIWLHGGGWVNGGLGSDNGFLRHVCKYVRCVVITLNYRHAPEHVYPTAINDVVAGIKSIASPETAETVYFNPSCYAIGGLSAGGCLTAIASMKIAMDAEMPCKPRFQLLICPVIDSTATVSSVWKTSQHSPWLTPGRMSWYQNMYYPNEGDRLNWDASPCFAPKEILSLSPKSWVAVAQCDLLAPEALAYATALQEAGVDVQLKSYKGATHSILVLTGIHKISQTLVHDACAVLARELGTSYDPSLATISSVSA